MSDEMITESDSKITPLSSDVTRYQLRSMYRSWYLDYASYVILERAVPNIADGLKPVQRRILHSMKTLDDGRFNKVANIVGNTMQYHPHGDASINDALVQLGQKELLIETQGNWGNVLTGDRAAAGRYIEARLSPFALEVLYNSKLTEWAPSYDGRKKEPVTLPAKFPLLLVQGVEGIAVGLSSKILPHNFNEILNACIAFLRGEEFALYPDFATGGFIDVNRYNDGTRGGAVKVRAKIEKIDNKTLAITEVPYGVTSGSLINSILKAGEKGKIKIRKVDDMTSESVRVMVYLQPGTSSDKAIDALYAFTDCEINIYPNCCVIHDKKPVFISISDVLRHSVLSTRDLLQRELEIQRDEVREMLHFASLERIFIEERIYKDKEYEQSRSFEEATAHIMNRLKPWEPKFIRPVTDDDVQRLYEIKMGRILRFNAQKAEETIAAYRDKISEIEKHLANITAYTIDWYMSLKAKYGDAFPRRTVVRGFDNIEAATVAEANKKLYINRAEGFIGTSLAKDEFICPCSDIDDVIIFYRDGKYKVVKVQEKLFVGKNIEHIDVFKRNDQRTVYNVIYRDGKDGTYFMKRFFVTGITRDKEYDITQGTPGSRICYFTRNPNGEAEVVRVTLKPKARLNKLQFDVDFGELAIKGKQSRGNIVTRNEVHRFSLREKGASTLGGRKVWFDSDVLRLNYDGRGDYLGEFGGTDLVLVILKNGEYYTSTFDASNHYEDNILRIEKFRPGTIWSAILFDADQGYPYIKRFSFEQTAKKQKFIGDNPKSQLILLSDEPGARFEVTFGGGDDFRDPIVIVASEFINVKSLKAKGKRLTTYITENIVEIDPVPVSDPDESETPDLSEPAVSPDDDDDNAADNDSGNSAAETEDVSDEQVRDEINGQQHLF
ncbi:MAG: DNA gyrase/topoisomerase IV subunit A [Muribaculaceae bacterium]|nr:DNA gyrase/topoisomerase IV subunit A [Muribaculaceae bacterium]